MTQERVITCIKIQDTSDPILFKIEKTYTGSFPETERRDFLNVIKLIESESRFKTYALFNKEVYIGFISTWQFDLFTYIEHFAIDELARNGGFGGIVMKEFIEKLSTPILLEVELPENEMSMRRIGFYERLGFQLDTHEYQQPPYREGEAWLPLRLMSYGDINMATHFEKIKQEIYRFVYNA